MKVSQELVCIKLSIDNAPCTRFKNLKQDKFWIEYNKTPTIFYGKLENIFHLLKEFIDGNILQYVDPNNNLCNRNEFDIMQAQYNMLLSCGFDEFKSKYFHYQFIRESHRLVVDDSFKEI